MSEQGSSGITHTLHHDTRKYDIPGLVMSLTTLRIESEVGSPVADLRGQWKNRPVLPDASGPCGKRPCTETKHAGEIP